MLLSNDALFEGMYYDIPVMFQSLFYWMLLSNLQTRDEMLERLRSFNPCFIGCYSLTNLSDEMKVFIRDLFQSLFYWMLLSNVIIILEYTIRAVDVSILVLLDVTL